MTGLHERHHRNHLVGVGQQRERDAIETHVRAALGDGGRHLRLRIVQAAHVPDRHRRRHGAGAFEHVELPQRGLARDIGGTRPRAQIRVVREDRQSGQGVRAGHRLEHLRLGEREHAALLSDLTEGAEPIAARVVGQPRGDVVDRQAFELGGIRPLHVVAAAGHDRQAAVARDARERVEAAAHVGMPAVDDERQPVGLGRARLVGHQRDVVGEVRRGVEREAHRQMFVEQHRPAQRRRIEVGRKCANDSRTRPRGRLRLHAPPRSGHEAARHRRPQSLHRVTACVSLHGAAFYARRDRRVCSRPGTCAGRVGRSRAAV